MSEKVATELPIPEPGENKRESLLAPIFVSVAVFCLLLFTSSFLPVVWDEGFVDERSDNLSHWLLRVINQVPGLNRLAPGTPEFEEFRQTDSLEMLISDWGIDTLCPGSEGHPLFPIFLALSKYVAPSFLPTIMKLRFGALVFFSLAVGTVFQRLRTDYGPLTATFGVMSILCIPRLFSHAHFATWDSPLTSSWMLCWALFPLALKGAGGAALLGVCVGLACSSKFSGVPVVLPIFLWLFLRLLLDRSFFAGRRIELLKYAGFTTVFAFLVFFFLNPFLWFDLFSGFLRFFRLNLNRDFNVSIMYFGRIYDLYHPLPWSNTLVWTAITVPTGLLALFSVGLFTVIRDREKRWAGLFLLLNFLTLIVIRALPGTPVHDGVRLFVAAFPFLGILAALGAARLWRAGLAPKVCVAGVYLCCVFNMFWYAPQWLSYYNLVIGGLPGAARAGMEPTYYWDGFDQEVIDWLNRHTAPGETVGFGSWLDLSFRLHLDGKDDDPHFRYFRAVDYVKNSDHGRIFRYYVLQRRPSAEYQQDRYLIENVEPAFVKTIRKGGWGPWNLGSVPIVEIYDLTAVPYDNIDINEQRAVLGEDNE